MAVTTSATTLQLPLLTHRGVRTTRATEIVHSVAGEALAELSLAPDLLISQVLAEQERTAPPSTEQRRAALRSASEKFLNDALGGIDFTEHLRLVAEASGHGPGVTQSTALAVAQAIAEAPDRADQGRPIGSDTAWGTALAEGGRGVWTRRGQTLAAVLSGNSPTIQNGWLQALALGYRVAVRPSRREPFTAFRVIAALRAAGLPDTAVAYLPTGHQGASTLLRRADLGLTYGGDDIMTRYAGSPTIHISGPGRTKTLLARPSSTHVDIPALADAVSALSGTGCVNTTGIYVHSDHHALAAQLAGELRTRAQRLRHTGDHLGPRVSAQTAENFIKYLRSDTSGDPVIPIDDIARHLPDGSVIIGPAVFTVDSPHHPALNTELPFPCVWVAPWSPSDGTEPLRSSLIVNADTDDTDLIDRLLNDPTVRNVYLGTSTTHSDGHLPHEDFVGNFLMRNKAVVGKPRP